MRIYISGRITSYAEDPETKAAEEACNLLRLHRAAALLRARGLEVWNPAELVADADTTHAQYMRACLRGLATCDRIVMLPWWGDSKGANAEVAAAEACGMKPEYIDDIVRVSSHDAYFLEAEFQSPAPSVPHVFPQA